MFFFSCCQLVVFLVRVVTGRNTMEMCFSEPSKETDHCRLELLPPL